MVDQGQSRREAEGKARRRGAGRQEAAEAAAVQIRAALAAGGSLDALDGKPKAPTFAEYGRTWLDTTAAVQCRPSTLLQYETAFRVHLSPAFGAVALDAITPDKVRAFVAKAHAAGRARNTIRRDVAVLAAILNTAIRDRLLTSNPAARLGKLVSAGVEAEAVEILTPNELVTLLATVEAHDCAALYPFVLTLARTGLRLGEAVALEWRDLDLGQRTLMVRRTATREKGVTNAPKNGKARRVDVSRQLADVLASWRTLQAAEAAVEGKPAPALVFQSIKGGPVHMTTFREKIWTRLLKAAGLRYVKPHALRHSYASHLLAAGVPPLDVAAQLGHHSAGFTLKVYGHVIPRSDRRVADVLDAAPDAPNRNPRATDPVGA